MRYRGLGILIQGWERQCWAAKPKKENRGGNFGCWDPNGKKQCFLDSNALWLNPRKRCRNEEEE